MKTAHTLLVAVAVLATGCLGIGADGPVIAQDTSLLALGELRFETTALESELAMLRLTKGPDVTLTFPPGVLMRDADGRLVPALGPIALTSGEDLFFLPPYGATQLRILVENPDVSDELVIELPADRARLVSGDFAVEELKRQRDLFPHRTPGFPAYADSQQYFVEFFEDLGYTVEFDPYGTMAFEDVRLPAGAGRGIGPASFANVVAYKAGTTQADRYIVFGGHYDVVEETVEGAFDNTAGTVATMAMAKALADVTTSHTIVFGLWGGEEDGILGSQFWASTNPEKMPFIDAYVNFDVTALAYPAPAVAPAAVVIAAGPDGIASAAIHAHTAMIEETYLQSGAEFVMQTVVQGQATGAGVNAQSDHTPFVLRGVPS